MNALFDLTGVIALAATVLALTRANAIHALLYAVVSLLAVAFIFMLLGAPFVAALEAIVYAGAIMVLFLFVAMALGLGKEAALRERTLLSPRAWLGPAMLAGALLAEVAVSVSRGGPRRSLFGGGSPKDLALALFGPYLIATEMTSLLLLAALVGAVHLGHRARRSSADRDEPAPSKMSQSANEARWS